MPFRDFSALSDAEAAEYLSAYVTEGPARVNWLKRFVTDQGGPPTAALDGSVGSLRPLWEWFVAWHDRGGGAGTTDEHPSWYLPDPPELAGQRLTPAELMVVDGLTHYVVECIQRLAPKAEWGIGKLPKRLRYIHQNQPVLKQLPGGEELNPRHAVYGLAFNMALRGKQRDPDSLEFLCRHAVEPTHQ
jgi:hypothetical protein